MELAGAAAGHSRRPAATAPPPECAASRVKPADGEQPPPPPLALCLHPEHTRLEPCATRTSCVATLKALGGDALAAPVPLDMVAVLDTSGSMCGSKLAQLQEAMQFGACLVIRHPPSLVIASLSSATLPCDRFLVIRHPPL